MHDGIRCARVFIPRLFARPGSQVAARWNDNWRRRELQHDHADVAGTAG